MTGEVSVHHAARTMRESEHTGHGLGFNHSGHMAWWLLAPSSFMLRFSGFVGVIGIRYPPHFNEFPFCFR